MIKFRKDSQLKTTSLSSKLLNLRLEGERIDLIVPRLSDYARWQDVRSRNQEFLKPYEPQWTKDALTEGFFKRRLERQKQEMTAGRGAFFLIHDKDNKEIIGGGNLNNIQYGAAYSASLGYWLDEAVQGQGYMHEATGTMIDYAFNVLKLRRLNAACLPDNDRSINMLVRHGFEEEGFAKKYLQINGEWQDHRLFGKVNNN